jgi:hypothetical protein
LKSVKQSAAAEQPFTDSRNSGEILEGSGFVTEPLHMPGFRVYMVALEMIFIALATLKAACRNLASNSSLMMVANLARLAWSHRCLVP